MFFENFTVKELSALAADLKIKGRSKMGKAELLSAISPVIDAAHDEAIGENNMRGWEALRLATSEPVVKAEPYVTAGELLTITGWKRLPRKYKKHHRKVGNLV
jgi:hypothetical protein